MSTWIHITNLPLYYDDYGLQDIFADIGQIVATKVTKNEMILKSTGFVQFASPKHAKLAASKKDQTVIANSAVRVYLLWTQNEDLSTIRVENIPNESTETDLEKYFDPYGEIVDITIGKDPKHPSHPIYAFISFCRVDYALNAVQEMNDTIIGMCGSLKVTLINPDARNLKWKRNSFQYKRLEIPQIHEINEYHYHHHHKRHNHNHRNNHNIIIVNNIGSIHNTKNDDDTKTNDGFRNRRGRAHHHHHHYHRHRNNQNNNQRHHRNNRRYHDESNKEKRKPRKYRSGRSVASQSTLLGPLHNLSNGQYHTYSVTPSPTRSNTDSNHSLSVDNMNYMGLQRMNSGDSSSSNCSAQSLPNSNYLQMKRRALDRYGFPSKQTQNHHSPQPYLPHHSIPKTPISPATTLSTPSSTHSMPTPTGYINLFQNMNMLSPSSLVLPLDSMQNNTNKSPQSVTSPIVLTPTTNLLLQQQLAFNSPSTLQGPPFNTPPHPQKRFVFNNNKKMKSLSTEKGKKSPSHSWTKEEEELGNKLYRIICIKYPERATKIVGMLLTANKTDDIKFMMERPHILMAVASEYDQQQRMKELNKNKQI